MADELQYSSDITPNKRKYEDQTAPPSSVARRPTGFSAPIKSAPDPAAAPPSYNNVPQPVEDFQAAKRRAEQIAARLLNSASVDGKRARVENGSGFDSVDRGYSSPTSISYGGFQGTCTSKKIEVPNMRVGVIIGKSGETIKYLQLRFGAKIQVTRDTEADLNSSTRLVELMGTPEQIAKAERFINDVLAEAEAGGSGTVAPTLTGQAGSNHFAMRVPNNKVVEEQWGSLGKMAVSAASHGAAPSRAHLHAIKNRKRGLTEDCGADLEDKKERDALKTSNRDYPRDVSLRHPEMRAPRAVDSLSWGKQKGQNMSTKDANIISAAVSGLNKYANDGNFMRDFIHQQCKDPSGSVEAHPNDERNKESEVVSCETKIPSESTVINEEGLSANKLAAKAMQLRLKGKHEEADKLLHLSGGWSVLNPYPIS